MATPAQRARRDTRIRQLAADGLSTRGIARAVHTSPMTVSRTLSQQEPGRPEGAPVARAEVGRATSRGFPAAPAPPARSDPTVAPSTSVREEDRDDDYWHQVWDSGYERGFAAGSRDAIMRWQIRCPCSICGQLIELQSGDATRMGVPDLLRRQGIYHVSCRR